MTNLHHGFMECLLLVEGWDLVNANLNWAKPIFASCVGLLHI